jgi:hypothetical protein
MNLRILPEPPNASRGFSQDVCDRHHNALKLLQESLQAERFHAMSLVQAAIAILTERAQTRAWRAATLMRELANVAVAFSNLPLYTNSPLGFRLGEDPEFRSAMRKAEQLANEQSAGSQLAATPSEVYLAVEKAPDVATKVALALTWICAGRVGDLLKTKQHEVMLDPSFATTGALKLQFCRGKGARFSQPYTVATTCPMEWRGLISQFLAQVPPRDWLFPDGHRTFGRLVNLALRTANPEFTVRALRRGALQAMAHAGVPTETLMTFSGHKRVDTLLRYLNWGAEAEGRAQQARAAAVHLVA